MTAREQVKFIQRIKAELYAAWIDLHSEVRETVGEIQKSLSSMEAFLKSRAYDEIEEEHAKAAAFDELRGEGNPHDQ